MENKPHHKAKAPVSRRGFLKTSGKVALTGGLIAGCGGAQSPEPMPPGPEAPLPAPKKPAIARHRVLGRTEFLVSDIGLGTGFISDANVVRYAHDLGINFIDTAEKYGNGDSERKIGEAMAHLNRKNIFLVTKLKIGDADTESTILDRFRKCQERLKTEYVDALYMHSVTDVSTVSHEGFHRAADTLKQEGRLRFVGISSHGPRNAPGDPMEKVLLTAVDDGRFDLMLLVYNFLNRESGEKVLGACREKNIGTTGMKTYTAKLELTKFDPDNPTEEHQKMLDYLLSQGTSKEEATTLIQARLDGMEKEWMANKARTDEFQQKYGIASQLELDLASVKWVLGNPEMHTVCVSMPDFDTLNRFLPVSGAELSARDEHLLKDYREAYGHRYCRHGCTECLSHCPKNVPVNTIMRYAYYFSHHRLEKHAMEKFATLGLGNTPPCLLCDAPCVGHCPHGVHIQSNLLTAHTLLGLG